MQDPKPLNGLRRVRTRRLLQIAAAVAVLYSLVLAGFYYAMKQPPETFSRVMKHVGPAPFFLFPFETMWKQARAGALHAGDAAPDFRLPLLDGSGSVELASLTRTQPVVLIFGSYT
jgi:hypothetical protein